MESNKIDGAEKDLSGEKREEITGKVQKETTPIEKKVTKRESEPEIDMERYSNLLKSAQGFYKSGNLKGAREELKQALIKNPKGYEAFTLLGQMELEANKVKSAITYLKRAISYNSGYAPAYFYLGTCYQLDGKNIEAKKMYQRYLNLAPDGEFANDVRAIMSDLK
ncbi:MAG: tetratricopeptide repeat protein, partial [Myxococcota bacterium]